MASDVEVAVITASPGLESLAEPQSAAHAVSWAAIIAGAFVAAAVSLLLFILGSGLGFAALRPWPGEGASAATFGVMAGVWLVIVQWAASGVGGYITGRLRTRWKSVHTHEVFFRDTAHGFLTWAVATVMVALLALGAVSMAAGAGASGREQAPQAAGAAGPYGYEVDTLLRSTGPADSASAGAARGEATRLLARAAGGASVTPDDRSWLTAVVAARTGVSAADAATRVDATIAAVRDKADKARKAASSASIFTALAMLVGAFIACVTAALGGLQRDEHP
jgi:hypothetical protein